VIYVEKNPASETINSRIQCNLCGTQFENNE